MERVKEILQENGLNSLANSLTPVTTYWHSYNDLFYAKDGDREVSIKLRKKSAWNIQNSLKMLSEIVDEDNFISKPDKTILSGEIVLIVSPWIVGEVPAGRQRNRIPDFFRMLAIFNKNNQVFGPFTSMYLDGRMFNSLAELVRHEAEGLLSKYEGKIASTNLEEILVPVGNCPACIIMEDLNVGNMIITSDGELKLIDCDYLLSGASIYQFDHLNLFGYDKSQWYNFSSEAKESASAYFEEMSIPRDAANDLIKAFQVLQLLRKAFFTQWKGDLVDWDQLDSNIERTTMSCVF